MKRVLIVLVVVLQVFGSRLFSEPQGALDTALERIYKEYSSFQGQPDVGRLVLLDQELRRLFEPASLSYSGKLLFEAHQRDQKIRRSYTLYSTVFREEEEGGMPSPAA